jgi:hypothetical protein
MTDLAISGMVIDENTCICVSEAQMAAMSKKGPEEASMNWEFVKSTIESHGFDWVVTRDESRHEVRIKVRKKAV